eukprot:Colp12_sorted_trinity150504_noHs@24633
MAPKGKPTPKKVTKKFTIDVSAPVSQGVMNAADLEKYLRERIKVNGKTGHLGEVITISLDKNKLTVNAETAFSKRYLKYLSKKFLKKNRLRDWLRVVATSPATYEFKFFKIDEEDEDEDQE